jgi:ribosomal protein S6--L-glutamate ligase
MNKPVNQRKFQLKLAILTLDPHLASSRRIGEAIQGRGHLLRFIDPRACGLDQAGALSWAGDAGGPPDGLVPRIGPGFDASGSDLVRAFQRAGVVCLNSGDAIALARHKGLTADRLKAAGVDHVPTTYLDDLAALEHFLGLHMHWPLVIKPARGSGGRGVVLCVDLVTAQTAAEPWLAAGQGVVVQPFIAEADGSDLRVWVIGSKVAAAMRRQAPNGEFRANLHQGGQARAIELTSNEKTLAVQAASALGLEVAGVDILRSRRGPVVLELNASPGLAGIEAATGVDLADLMVARLEGLVNCTRD